MTHDDATPTTPVRETERLVVRDWRDDEVDRLFDMYSRLEVVRFLGSVPTPMASVDEARQRIRRVHEVNAEHAPFGWWAVEVRETGVVAGTVGLLPIEDTEDVEVFWHLHPDSQGNGYATEAARGVIEYGHRHGFAEVLALVDQTNAPSLEVVRRLGLQARGESTRYYGKPLEVFVSQA